MARYVEAIQYRADIAEVKAKLAELRRETRSTQDATERDTAAMSGHWDRVGTAIGAVSRLAVVGAGLLGAAGVAMAGFGISVAAQAEQAEIGFTTLLGSGERAKAFLGELQQFAATTPFEFPQLRDAASRLLAVGTTTEEVIPLMRALGDATSAMGTGAEGIDRAVTALTQMRQKGKVTGEEMLQLAEAGIPAWDALATKLGVDVATAQDKVSKGQVEVNALYEALSERAGPAMERVAGMMDKQSQSLVGLLSTLKDTVSLALGDMMGPAVQAIKGALPDLTSTIQSALGAIAPHITSLATGIVSVAQQILPALVPIVGQIGGLFGKVFERLAPVIQALVPHITNFADRIAPLASLLIDLVGDVLEPLLPALMDIATAFVDALTPAVEDLQPAIEALAPVLADLARFFAKVIEKMGPTGIEAAAAAIAVVKLGGAFKSAIGALQAMSAAMAANPWMLLIAGLVVAAVLIVKNWDKIKAAFAAVWDAIKDAAGAAVDWFRQLPGMIWDAISGISTWVWNNILQYHPVVVMVRLAMEWGPKIIDFLTGLPAQIWDALVGLSTWVWTNILQYHPLVLLYNAAVQWGPTLVGFLVGIPGQIWDALSGLASWVWNNILQYHPLVLMYNAALEWGPRVVGAVGETLGSLVGTIASFAGSVFNSATEIGRAIVRGIIGGLDAVADFAGDIASAVGRGVQRALNELIGLLENGVNTAIDALDAAAGPFVNFPSLTLPRLNVFHEGGVAADEMLAILRKDETVFTPDQMGALGEVIATAIARRPQIGHMSVATDQPARTWFDEALWRVA